MTTNNLAQTNISEKLLPISRDAGPLVDEDSSENEEQ